MSTKCDNCKKYLPVRISYENDKPIFIPVSTTTNVGGQVCGTGCAISYIKKKTDPNYKNNLEKTVSRVIKHMQDTKEWELGDL